jgi:NADP-dependent 3-hydroxy acid dehydrogenase YdfG
VNKVILITGASSGFGRLTANALADAREHRRAFESEVLTPR